MSMTKQLKKRLETMSRGEIEAEIVRLRSLHESEKNTMKRSSINERIRMCSSKLGQESERCPVIL